MLVRPELVEDRRGLRRPVAQRERRGDHRQQVVRRRSAHRPVRDALAAVRLVPLVLVRVQLHPDLLLGQQVHHPLPLAQVGRVGLAGPVGREAGPQRPDPGAVETVPAQPARVARLEPRDRVRRHVGLPLVDQVQPVDDHHPAVLVDQPAALAVELRRGRCWGRPRPPESTARWPAPRRPSTAAIHLRTTDPTTRRRNRHVAPRDRSRGAPRCVRGQVPRRPRAS